MQTYTPKKPSGAGSLWQWRRWIWDLLAGGLFPIKGDDPVIVTWENGFYRITAKKSRGGGGTGGPSMFLLVSDGGDYYNCQATTDGVTGNGPYVKVAKTQDLRCILSTATPAGGAWNTKTIRTITYTYTYTPTGGTTADGVNVLEYVRGVTGSDSSADTSEVTPCLNVGDIIWADPFAFTDPATLSGVQWLARPDGRTWSDADPA